MSFTRSRLFVAILLVFMVIFVDGKPKKSSESAIERYRKFYRDISVPVPNSRLRRKSFHHKRSSYTYNDGIQVEFTPSHHYEWNPPQFVPAYSPRVSGTELQRRIAIAKFKIQEKRRLQAKLRHSLYNQHRYRAWWGTWSNWSACSRTCGKGVQFQERHCLGNVNLYLAKRCVGESKRARLCNKLDCSASSQTYRQLQCAQHAAKAVTVTSWKPYGHSEDEIVSNQPCQLVCVSYTNEFQINTIAFDGTECHRGWHPGRCVEGKCKLIGCDGVLGSRNLRDKCGECGKNGTSCSIIEGVFSERVPGRGLYKVVTLPKGAYDIIITERKRTTTSRLTIKDAYNNTLLDGQTDEVTGVGADGWPSDIRIAGSDFRYRRPLAFSSNEGFEYIIAAEPIQEEICVYIYTRLSSYNQLYYEYKLRKDFSEKPTIMKENDDVIDDVTTTTKSTTTTTTTQSTTTTASSTTTTQEPPTEEEALEIPHKLVVPPNKVVMKPAPSQDNFGMNGVFLPGLAPVPVDFPPRLVEYKFLEEEEDVPEHSYHPEEEDFLTFREAEPDIKVPALKSVDSNEDLPSTPSLKFKPLYSRLNPTKLDQDKTMYEIAAVFTVQRKLSGKGENASENAEVSVVEAPLVIEEEADIEVNSTEYQWKTNGFAPCSSTCSGGAQDSYIVCERISDELQVDEIYCDKSTKPFPVRRHCFDELCAPRWESTPWSVCSKSCGEGVQMRTARCWQMIKPGFDSTVYIEKCDSIIDQKPSVQKACVVKAKCGPMWETTEWSNCNAKCGTTGVRRRTVRCSQKNSLSNPSKPRPCNGLPAPPATAWCQGTPCVLEWAVSDWGQCSGECGGGRKTRRVSCIDRKAMIRPDFQCDPQSKPVTYIPCGDVNCRPEWVAQDWGECSAECGAGDKQRQVTCASIINDVVTNYEDNSPCDQATKPPVVSTCKVRECDPSWFTTPWSKCSVTCGNGQKVRKVTCYLNDEQVEGCQNDSKPPISVACEMPDCPRPTACSNKKNVNCGLVMRLSLCEHWYYKGACCATCRQAGNK